MENVSGEKVLGVVNEDSGKRRQPARNAQSRADVQAGVDDSKETNTAVVHPVIDASGEGKGRFIMMLGIWRQG